MLASTIDQAHYRNVMGHLPTGLVALSGITPTPPTRAAWWSVPSNRYRWPSS